MALTPEQQKNEDIAQAARFASPTAGQNTSGYSSLKELSIANSPADTVAATNNRGGINRVSQRESTGAVVPGTTGINRPVNEPNTPDFYGEAYDELSKDAQKRINAINQYASKKLESLQPRQDERLQETKSVNTLTGLAGSTEANRTTEETASVNKKENDLVLAEAEAQVAMVMDNLSSQALAKAQFDRETYTQEANRTAEERVAQIEENTRQATTLAQAGVTADGFKATNPEAYQLLADSLGGEEILKATFTLNRPTEQILDKRIEGGKYVIAYQNPIDGKVRLETVDLGLPTGYSKTIDAGNRILAVPDDWDGDPSKLVTINKGISPTAALSASGGSLGTAGPSGSVARDAQSIMDGVLNLNDVSTAKNYRSEVAAELRKRAQEANADGDIYGVMRSSAAYDKEVSDTFLQSMEKTLTVLGQLGALQENISGTDTGPIVGAFRAKNPWDTNAQTIKAQLNAIVPNLARGVYGEVGVLTDNDIRTYSQTLPNLTSTEAVRNAILYITVDMIKRNVETKIKNQAAGQRDMSGYADIYQQLQSTASQVLSTIPNDANPGASNAGYDDESTAAVAAPIGSIVVLNGQQYIKTGDDNYEPAGSAMSTY